MRQQTSLLLLLGMLAALTPGFAQTPNFSANLPGFSPLSRPEYQQQAQEPEFNWVGAASGVSIIDSALPRSMARVRFEVDYTNRRPTRAEHLFAKGGFPGSTGMPLPETKVHAQELFWYTEMALLPEFSFFINQPWRWVNPEMNANASGLGDMDFGLKWVIFGDAAFLTALQLRLYVPFRESQSLGTNHVTFEPSLLVNAQLADFLTIEGELRYWVPVNGSDFAGNVLRYGVGLVYGQRGSGEIWLTPVAELVGWTVTDGKVMAAQTDGSFSVADAAGDTILNAYLGTRIGFGHNADLYLGYGRCLSGQSWYRDMARVELRFLF